MARVQKIAPCLWFDSEAEQAARYYTGIFKNSRMGRISHYTEAGKEVHGQRAGKVLTVDFELEGQPFTALNGGPQFKFNEAVSLQINCENQAEIDYYWDKLGAGGDPNAQQCGWLKDKFGLSWQVIPAAMGQLMSDSDPARASRTMEALLKMKKLDIAALERAAEGREKVGAGR
jgi:predicted 3-demethylubiquinone-9 3-methyltransferase (glyoxalase superfamily)